MGNAKKIARRIVGLAEMSTPPPRPARDGPVCPSCDGDAELSGTPGQISCFNCGYNGPSRDRPALVDPRDDSTDCEECSASLDPGVDPIDAGWIVGQTDGEFLCEECKMNPGDDPDHFRRLKQQQQWDRDRRRQRGNDLPHSPF